MARDKIQMPSSTAGITRYFDEYKSKLRFKPGHVLIIGIVVMIITIMLHWYGTSFLSLAG
jgi:preprotein translocase subunit Sec61beta